MRRFFIAVWLVIIALNALVLLFAFLALRRDRVPVIRYEVAAQLGPAITNIVDRIILDVGLLDKDGGKKGTASEESKPKVPPSLSLVPADVSGLDVSSGWVNGRRFDVGCVIVPYGAIVAFSGDSVVLRDLNDPAKLTVLASGLPVLPAVGKKEESTPKVVKSDEEKQASATVKNNS